MSDGKRYEIRNVKDFTLIPKEDLKDCLQDFQSWLDTYHELKDSGHPNAITMETFRWINDGKHDRFFRISL